MFWIGGVKVNGIHSASSLGIGPKVISGVRSHSKSTTGNGSVRGDYASLPLLAGWINDPDLFDTPVWISGGESESGQEG